MRLYLILLCTLLLVAGCATHQNNSKPSNNGSVAKATVKEQVGIQHRNVTKINNAADAAEKKAPETKPEMTEIKEATKEIGVAANTLEKNHEFYSEAVDKQHEIVVKENTALKKEVTTLKDQNTAQQRRILSMIVIASGLWMAVSIALFFLGTLRSVTLIVIAGSVLAGAIALQFLTAYTMLIGGVLVAMVGGFMIYQAWVNRRALKEVVGTAEKTKEQIGTDTFHALANEEQSPSTQKIVKNIRVQSGLTENPKIN